MAVLFGAVLWCPSGADPGANLERGGVGSPGASLLARFPRELAPRGPGAGDVVAPGLVDRLLAVVEVVLGQ